MSERAKITDNITLIEYFIEGLNVGIFQKIFLQPTISKQIDEWYEQASRYDTQYWRILRRCWGVSSINQPKKTFTPWYINNTQDPNIIDVDKMIIKEWEKYIKENQCFNCHKIEHRAKDCHQKNQGSSSKTNTTNDESKTNNEKSLVKYEGKKTANTTWALIWNLVADMEKQEKDKLFEKTRIFKEATYLNVRITVKVYEKW